MSDALRIIPQVPVTTDQLCSLLGTAGSEHTRLATAVPCSTIHCKPDASAASANGAMWAVASDLRACRASRPSGPVLDAPPATAVAGSTGQPRGSLRPLSTPPLTSLRSGTASEARYASRPPCCAHSPLEAQPNPNLSMYCHLSAGLASRLPG